MSKLYDYPDSPLYRLRHSAAHLLAQAVLELYPDAKLGVGPPIENGFYYDFDFPEPVREEDLQRIEEKMREIAARALDIVRFETTREEAEQLIRKIGQVPYKVELLQAIPEGETISFYQQGDFIDLCRGPHLENTREIKHFKLLSLAGAYWRGDERNKMLTRIYGTAFFTQEELDDYLHRLEEAKRRDHRKLGRELGLFLIAPEVGSGLPMLLPKGATIRRVLEEFILHEELKAGYQHVRTPEIANLNLYRTSGHYPYYKDSMYPPMVFEDGEELILRPMNCPHHFLIYKSEPRSYRDLPLRIAELGTVYRYEKSGELSGLIRVRCFTHQRRACVPAPRTNQGGGAAQYRTHPHGLQATAADRLLVSALAARPRRQREILRRRPDVGDGGERPAPSVRRVGAELHCCARRGGVLRSQARCGGT